MVFYGILDLCKQVRTCMLNMYVICTFVCLCFFLFGSLFPCLFIYLFVGWPSHTHCILMLKSGSGLSMFDSSLLA